MKKTALWLLWLWISLAIVGAFVYAPPAEGFLGQSSRILFFHVPMAWASFVGFMAAGAWSALYLFGGRHRRHDDAAAAAVEVGIVFCILATVTGSMWARTEWGAFWNWDPRQVTIVMALLFYAAYLALRGAVADEESRARLAASYALLGVVVAPFLMFVLPRITYSLHPQPVVNAQGKIQMDASIGSVLTASSLGFTALYFWMHKLRWRVQSLSRRNRSLG